jgi:type I restriction enzyme S subunit
VSGSWLTASQLTARTGHWTRVRLRHLGKLKAGAGFPDAEQGIQGQDLPFFKVKHLAEADGDACLRLSEHTVSRDTAAQLGAFVFPAGTIVFAKVGAALLLTDSSYSTDWRWWILARSRIPVLCRR